MLQNQLQHFIFIQMNLLQRFKDHWHNQFSSLTKDNCRLLVTVSGGVDSVVLLDLIANSGFEYKVAHANFQLRKEESSRDENFVRTLAQKYGKEILIKHFETEDHAAATKVSIQEAARNLRYQWFSVLADAYAKEPGALNRPVPCYILTAHHADDNIETLLMHFFRGTGIQGLTGIQALAADRNLIRPLLPFRKSELLEHAKENQLTFVEDSSNASDKYTRNYFRNKLLPQISEVFPKVEDNLLNNLSRFIEVGKIYENAVQQQLHKLMEKNGEEWHISVLKWKKSLPLHTLSWELIKPFGYTAAQVGEVIKLLDAVNGSYVASNTHRIIKNRNWMIITKNTGSDLQHQLIEKTDEELLFGKGKLVFTENSIGNGSQSIDHFKQHSSPDQICINSEHLQFPLLLRKWKQGDYFYPLGMQKKKKISRFLIDQKLSRTEKENTWVLESDKKILWVVGMRIDDRFKLTDSTQKVMCVHYLK